MNYSLKELLDVSVLQDLLDSLYQVNSMSSAVLDIDGNILTATAWQNICTNFHRQNPEAVKRCTESDRHIESKTDENAQGFVCRCPLGLVNSALPIIIEGKHLGNVYIGQLFIDPPDESQFILQARQYEFVLREYLEAMRKVPFFSEEQVLHNLKLVGAFVTMNAEKGLQNKRLLETGSSLQMAGEKVLVALKYAENIIDTVREPMLVLDSNLKVISANRSFFDNFKVSHEETLGRFIYDLGDRQWDIPSLRVLLEEILPLETVFNDYEVEHNFLNVGRKTMLLNARQVYRENVDSHIILLAIEDITERRQYLEQIRQLAFYDTLTSLPNRRLLMDRLHQILAQAKRYKRPVALMFLDLDNFKQVNDTLGHTIGDELLKVVASRLLDCVRGIDTVCRQGGDEFIVVVSEITHPEGAAIVAKKIITTLSEQVCLQGNEIRITASIGIAIYPVGGTDSATELINKADKAMYQLKQSGRNGFTFYSEPDSTI